MIHWLVLNDLDDPYNNPCFLILFLLGSTITELGSLVDMNWIVLPPVDRGICSHSFGHVVLDTSPTSLGVVLIFPGNADVARRRLRVSNSITVRYVSGNIRRSIQNAQAAYRYCEDNRLAVRTVYCFSIGAGIFAEAVQPDWKYNRLYLHAPLPNLHDLVQRKVGKCLTWILVSQRTLATHDLLLKKLSPGTRCRIAHSLADEVIPVHFSWQLLLDLQRVGCIVEWDTLRGAHNGLDRQRTGTNHEADRIARPSVPAGLFWNLQDAKEED